jgi:hypothetical protein
MPQEYQTHDGHEKLVRGKIRIRPQSIRSTPEPLFYRFNIYYPDILLYNSVLYLQWIFVTDIWRYNTFR